MKSFIPLSEDVEDRIFRKAFLSRLVEERLLSLFQEGKLFGTVHTCIGQEFTGAVLTEFLRKGDTIFSNHRCHGHFLSWTGDTRGLIAELMGRETGVCAGRGGSQHLCKDGFFSNGIQGGIVPVASGLALAHRYEHRGNLSVVFIGDGTLGEGAIYEAFNMAGRWRLPLLIVVEDNGFAQSTAKEETFSGSIMGRAEAFGLATAHANTWDLAAFHKTAGEFIERLREGQCPGLLLVDTFRLKAHSKGDDNRPAHFVQPFELKDLLNQRLKVGDAKTRKLISELEAEVDAAVSAADEARFPKLPPPREAETRVEWHSASLPEGRLVKALNEYFTRLMRENEKVVFLGEDIKSPYGGAFKVTQGLSDLAPDRVFNAPISEAGIVGMGTGLSMKGFRPIVEIMFGDFLGLAFDQILNHAAKFEDMYNGQVHADVVIRTPMGGRRGYGPTHSQTLDRHFLGTPGLQILALNSLIDPASVYAPVFKERSGPVLMIENKILYGTVLRQQMPEGFTRLVSDEKFPTVHLRPESSTCHITLLGYGGMGDFLAEAQQILFEEHDMIAQVICPTKIYPFNVSTILPLIARAPDLMIVEEGQGFAGFGAEVIAQLAESDRSIRVRRHYPPAMCIPSSGLLEAEMLPDVKSIVNACVKMRAHGA